MELGAYLSVLSKFFIRRYPFQITHFVTSKCNARCNHCFYWKKLNKEKNELTLEEIDKVSKSIPQFFSLMLTGGEPFLRDDLSDIAQVYYKNNKIKNLGTPTNGFLPDKIYKTAKRILDSCPGIFYTVSISLDGLGADHDKSRGVPGAFEKVKETYSKLSELKKSYKNFNVDFLTAVTVLNEKKLKEIYDYIKNNFKTEVIMIMLRGDPKNPDLKCISQETFEYISKLQKDKFKDLSSFNQPRFKLLIRKRMHNLRHDLIMKTARENKYVLPCYAGRLDAIIYEGGDVFPCEILDMRMGNLREFNNDFKKLWNSKQAQKVRDYIKDSKCFCTHECANRTNILFNPKVMFRGKL